MTTPSFTNAILQTIKTQLAGINLSLPAKVVTYDAATVSVSVQPLIRRRVEQEDGTLAHESRPIIEGVPLVFPGLGANRITFPVNPGDLVTLQFASSSLDRWLAKGGEVNADDDRHGALSDAIAIPGITDFKNASPASTDDAVIIEAATEIRLGSQGASDPVARKSDLDALKMWLDAHVHSGVTTGAGASGTAGSSPSPGTSKVKAD